MRPKVTALVIYFQLVGASWSTYGDIDDDRPLLERVGMMMNFDVASLRTAFSLGCVVYHDTAVALVMQPLFPIIFIVAWTLPKAIANGVRSFQTQKALSSSSAFAMNYMLIGAFKACATANGCVETSPGSSVLSVDTRLQCDKGWGLVMRRYGFVMAVVLATLSVAMSLRLNKLIRNHVHKAACLYEVVLVKPDGASARVDRRIRSTAPAFEEASRTALDRLHDDRQVHLAIASGSMAYIASTEIDRIDECVRVMEVLEVWEAEQIHGAIIGASSVFVYFNLDAGLFSIFILMFKAGFVYYAISRPWISAMMAVVLALAFLFLAPYVDPHNNAMYACTMGALAAFVFSADGGITLQAVFFLIPIVFLVYTGTLTRFGGSRYMNAMRRAADRDRDADKHVACPSGSGTELSALQT